MYQPGKFECIQRESSCSKIDIFGLAEVRWTKSGKLTTYNHVMVYSGHQKETTNGVSRETSLQRPLELSAFSISLYV